ncbi:hypothetical protein B0H10DRAFT_1963939 [Mycena sp. CBHHK59/15]|nr:hypothetical protein B0H10DRAFT_1963939 [Mycena sp. CBHHK59/15]
MPGEYAGQRGRLHVGREGGVIENPRGVVIGGTCTQLNSDGFLRFTLQTSTVLQHHEVRMQARMTAALVSMARVPCVVERGPCALDSSGQLKDASDIHFTTPNRTRRLFHLRPPATNASIESRESQRDAAVPPLLVGDVGMRTQTRTTETLVFTVLRILWSLNFIR